MSATSSSPMDIYAAPQTLVWLNRRRRFNLHLMGEGGPTVILAAGFLGGPLDWGRVQPFVARFARTVTYDNAGLGFSDPGPRPRTTDAIVDDLRAALAAAGIAPPYVLAGHSAGGLRMRRFAERWPDEVAGLVMIDSVLADWERRLDGGPCPAVVAERVLFRRMLAMARTGALTPQTSAYRDRIGLPRPELSPAVNAALHAMWTRPSYLATAISESSHLGTGGEPGPAPVSLGDLPLRVLSAGRVAEAEFIGGDAGRAKAWFAMHDELAALSTRGARRVLDGGHNLPIDCPRQVVAAIEEVVVMARADLAARSSR